MKTLTLIRPDDAHVHFRDNAYLSTTVQATARTFARAVIMPNLVPPVTTVDMALDYRTRILNALEPGFNFTPLMTLYLTGNTDLKDIELAAKDPAIIGCKWYPAGATTHSEQGIHNIADHYAILAKMEEVQLPLLIHGEVTDPSVDIFDRERCFIDTVLVSVQKKFPALKIVLEHITTQDAVAFISESPNNVAATITVHHLLYNRNALLSSGIHPHYYCLPVLKRRTHQEALIKAATSGNPHFFLGTDSAPHPQHEKECACGKAGIFSAPVALELYAQVFDESGALDKLANFASRYAADFYGLSYNKETITLTQEEWCVPAAISCAGQPILPLYANKTVGWKITQPPSLTQPIKGRA